MVSTQTQNIADLAKAIYASRLQSELESNHPGRFVAIEPESGDYFLADSFSGAVAASRVPHPTQISFVIRIGYEAAIHIGATIN